MYHGRIPHYLKHLSAFAITLVVLSSCATQIRSLGRLGLAVSNSSATTNSVAFTDQWPFTAGTQVSYTFNSSLINFAGGTASLIPYDQTDDDDLAAGFLSSTLTGAAWNSGSSSIELANAGGCDATSTNCSELDSSWTPGYSSIVGYWKFNNNLNDTIGGHTFTGVGSGTFTANTRLGTYSYSNPGTTSYLTQNDHADFQFGNGDFTVSYWVYPRTDCTGYSQLWGPGQWNTGGSPGTNAWDFGHCDGTAGNSNVWDLVVESGATQHYIIATSTWTKNRWYHIIGTRVGANVSLYVNGILMGSSNVGAVFPLNSVANKLRVGASDGGPFDADVSYDELAIWKGRGLSATEVSAIYTRQAPRYSGSVVSRILDVATSMPWTSLAWTSSFPGGKDLPSAGANETTTTYSGLANSTLMSGIQALWHMNESTSGTAPGATDFKDDSGGGFHATKVGSPTFAVEGRLGRSVQFTPNAQYATFSNIALTGDFTLSAWVYLTRMVNVAGPQSANTAINYDAIFGNGTGAGVAGNDVDFTSGKLRLYNGTAAEITAATTASMGIWEHYVITRSGTSLEIYRNGVSDQTATAGAVTTYTFNKLGAGKQGVTNTFNGRLDEVAIWNRALSSTEASQLYQRGTSRIRFQIRSCVASDCTGASFVGPDGTTSTTFSELNNNSNPITSDGTTPITAPTMSFPDFSGNGLTVANHRYFQYQAFLESDSTTNTQLKSVVIGPDHYDSSAAPSISSYGIAYTSLNAFTETLGASSCSAGIRYNLSADNGVTWYWWDAAANAGAGGWATANNTYAKGNDAATTNTHIADFSTLLGSGNLYFKAFLKSDGASACEIDQVDTGGMQ